MEKKTAPQPNVSEDDIKLAVVSILDRNIKVVKGWAAKMFQQAID